MEIDLLDYFLYPLKECKFRFFIILKYSTKGFHYVFFFNTFKKNKNAVTSFKAVRNIIKYIDCVIHWFWRHINKPRVILCLQGRESRSLCIRFAFFEVFITIFWLFIN